MAKPTRERICKVPHPLCIERFKRVEARMGTLERDRKWLKTALAKLAAGILEMREKTTVISQRSEVVEGDIRGILRRLDRSGVVLIHHPHNGSEDDK